MKHLISFILGIIVMGLCSWESRDMPENPNAFYQYDYDYKNHLRDQFAMAAMNAIIIKFGFQLEGNFPRQQMADEAYKMADAMMIERSKHK